MKSIEQLVLIAGSSCSGKTYIIKRLKQKKLASLRRQIGIADPNEWHMIDLRRLGKLQQIPSPRLVVHYDLGTHQLRRVAELIRQAEKVTALTLYAPTNLLILRTVRRLLSPLRFLNQQTGLCGELARTVRLIKRLRQRRHRPERLAPLYQNWTDLLEEHRVPHYSINTENPIPDTAAPAPADWTPGLFQKNSIVIKN